MSNIRLDVLSDKIKTKPKKQKANRKKNYNKSAGLFARVVECIRVRLMVVSVATRFD
jgi:hypothetical protein